MSGGVQLGAGRVSCRLGTWLCVSDRLMGLALCALHLASVVCVVLPPWCLQHRWRCRGLCWHGASCAGARLVWLPSRGFLVVVLVTPIGIHNVGPPCATSVCVCVCSHEGFKRSLSLLTTGEPYDPTCIKWDDARLNTRLPKVYAWSASSGCVPRPERAPHVGLKFPGTPGC